MNQPTLAAKAARVHAVNTAGPPTPHEPTAAASAVEQTAMIRGSRLT
jgi:hypothetical protein